MHHEDAIYESQLYTIRIAISSIIASVLLLAAVYAEFWVFKITANGQLFFFVLFSGGVLAVLVLPMVSLVNYIFLARPKLSILSDQLIVGEQTILFTDIEDIDIDAQLRSLRHWPEEMVDISLKKGLSQKIIVSRYSNGNLFRVFCNEIKKGIATRHWDMSKTITPEVVLTRDQEPDLSEGDFIEFRPNLFASPLFYYGLMTSFLSIVCLVVPIKGSSYNLNAIFAALLFLTFLWVVSQQRYFMVSPKYLVIKSYLPLISTIIIRIDGIRKIEIVTVLRASKISIMTTDYEIHNFTTDRINFSNKVIEMVDAVNELIKK